MSRAGMFPIGAGGAGWMIEEIGVSCCGEIDGRSAPVGVSGGEGEVGFLINEWGETGCELDWVWAGSRANF
jgi:hypothetical protein